MVKAFVFLYNASELNTKIFPSTITFAVYAETKIQNGYLMFSHIPFYHADLYNFTLNKLSKAGFEELAYITQSYFNVNSDYTGLRIFSVNADIKGWVSNSGEGLYYLEFTATKK